MSKKVLILVLSSDFFPYNEMIATSKKTWDSEVVEGCETIFYCSKHDNPGAVNHDNVMYFDVPNDLYSMGRKNLAMFEWALQNKEFDYVLRVNASQYVCKKNLVEYVQTLPDKEVFSGAEVKEEGVANWFWGGCGFLFSKDIIQLIVDNKNNYNHTVMEDKSISYLINSFGIPVIPAKSGSIDNMGDCWRMMLYGGDESFEFTDFADVPVKAKGHFCFRIKQDGKRYVEKFIMEELKRVLQ